MDSTVQTYITDLSNGEADTTQAANYYEDIIGQLAAIPVLCEYVANLSPSSGSVTIPTAAVNVLLAFWKDTNGNVNQLGELSVREANYLQPDWRETTGTPTNFVRDSYNSTNFQLVPQDSTASSVSLVTTEVISSSLPVWLQMPVALLILYYEYMRESSHRSVELAQACRALGMFMLKATLTGAGS